MWIMLSLVAASLLLSGFCITDNRIKELLLKPSYVDKEIVEVVEQTDEIAEEDIAALTELAEQEQLETASYDKDMSEVTSLSVQDILNKKE